MFLETLGSILTSGWLSLLDYLAAHVLLCLLPAFVIAGYMSTMIPQEAVTRYLGPKASKFISYPAAAISGFILAVCSCTILPLFAGIWKRGAGLGAAITFLFVGPAVNILAIAYTGAAIGMDIAIARIVLSIIFGIAIGLLMSLIFRKEEEERMAEMKENGMFEGDAKIPSAVWIVFILLFLVLIVGTLQIDLLTREYLTLNLGSGLGDGISAWLSSLNLTGQGALLILLLGLIGAAAMKGFDNIIERFDHWSVAAITLIIFTILFAALGFTPGMDAVSLSGRFFGEVILFAAIILIARKSFTTHQVAEWLWEMWKFVKQIFPLLLAGVFVAGMVKDILPEQWIQSLAGRNTLWANLLGVLFGVFMYFPTLVEVPIAKMFLDLGMHRGPLLAYLLADPELSVQSILVTGRILGKEKTAIYVTLVTIFSTLAGYLFGLFMTVVG